MVGDFIKGIFSSIFSLVMLPIYLGFFTGLSLFIYFSFTKDFEIQNIHHFWSSDFTHLYFKGVEFYLATILDEYSKQIVGYSL